MIEALSISRKVYMQKEYQKGLQHLLQPLDELARLNITRWVSWCSKREVLLPLDVM